MIQQNKNLTEALNQEIHEGLQAKGVSEISVRLVDNQEDLVPASKAPVGFDSKEAERWPGKAIIHVALTSDSITRARV